MINKNFTFTNEGLEALALSDKDPTMGLLSTLAAELLSARKALEETNIGWCEKHGWIEELPTGSCPICFNHLTKHRV